MKTIAFNTGRFYAANGQIIIATLHDDGVVTFFDHARLIDGEFKLGIHGFDAREVLHFYDAGDYQGSRRSWQDGMDREGCNRWTREGQDVGAMLALFARPRMTEVVLPQPEPEPEPEEPATPSYSVMGDDNTLLFSEYTQARCIQWIRNYTASGDFGGHSALTVEDEDGNVFFTLEAPERDEDEPEDEDEDFRNDDTFGDGMPEGALVG